MCIGGKWWDEELLTVNTDEILTSDRHGDQASNSDRPMLHSPID